MDDPSLIMEPKTIWITVFAWVCCSCVWLLIGTGGWWAVIPSLFLCGASFALAVGKDLKDMK